MPAVESPSKPPADSDKEPSKDADPSRTALYVRLVIVALVIVLVLILAVRSRKAGAVAERKAVELNKFDMRAEVAKLKALQQSLQTAG